MSVVFLAMTWHSIVKEIPNQTHEENLTEEVVAGKRLFDEMNPQWLRIGGYWYPRGGIPIDVFWQSGEPPKGLWIPDQGVANYRGRG